MAKKKFYETEEFAQLNAEWKQKLEESGFDDIEKNETDTIIRPQEFYPASRYAFTKDYYEYCQDVLRNYPFKRDIDQIIFELHAQGMSDRQIEAELKRRELRAYTYRRVNQIVNQIKNDFGRM